MQDCVGPAARRIRISKEVTVYRRKISERIGCISGTRETLVWDIVSQRRDSEESKNSGRIFPYLSAHSMTDFNFNHYNEYP